jgi:arylsulfatase
MGQLDNTLVFYILGDNGASAEGGMNGLFNEMTYFNAVPEASRDILKHYDQLGGPISYPLCCRMGCCRNTPFTWTKQVASTMAVRGTGWSSIGQSDQSEGELRFGGTM